MSAETWRVVCEGGEVRLAQVTADRDYWREQMTAAAPCVDAIRHLTSRVIRGGTGCVVEPRLAVDTALARVQRLPLLPMDLDAADDGAMACGCTDRKRTRCACRSPRARGHALSCSRSLWAVAA